MNSKFVIYAIDTETSSIDHTRGEIIELSVYRLSDDTQKTWCLKPTNYDTIEPEALRVNGHKIEDLKHQTKFGVETYLDPKKAIVEMENWMLEDMVSAKERIFLAQNAVFDLNFMKALWQKHASLDTFPFGDRPRILDTLQLALFLDIAFNETSEYYNLGSLVEKYGVKKEKTHAAASDTRMCKNVFLKQLAKVQNLIKQH